MNREEQINQIEEINRNSFYRELLIDCLGGRTEITYGAHHFILQYG